MNATVENEMKLATTRNFGELAVEVYENPQKEFFMTRDQIGTALEYEKPNEAISQLHKRNEKRLDQFSTMVKMKVIEGDRLVTRPVRFYTLKGAVEICRFSHQPKTGKFMDFCLDTVKALHETTTQEKGGTADMVQTFQSEEFGNIRSVMIDMLPWFIGKDVAMALGYKDTINALKSHVDTEDKRGGESPPPPVNSKQLSSMNPVCTL